MHPIVADGEAKPVEVEVVIPEPTPIADPTKTLVLAGLRGLFFHYTYHWSNWPRLYHGEQEHFARKQSRGNDSTEGRLVSDVNRCAKPSGEICDAWVSNNISS